MYKTRTDRVSAQRNSAFPLLSVCLVFFSLSIGIGKLNIDPPHNHQHPVQERASISKQLANNAAPLTKTIEKRTIRSPIKSTLYTVQ